MRRRAARATAAPACAATRRVRRSMSLPNTVSPLRSSCASSSRASNQKRLPCPGSLATPTSPPISCARWRVIARPRPVPPKRRVVELSACVKAANSWPSCSGAMPMPVSRTLEAHAHASRSRSPAASHAQRDPPVLGELHRVAQQVEQRLRQPRRVAAQASGTCRLSSASVQALGARAFGHQRAACATAARRSEKSMCSSSSLPASIFDRSRMSLITCSRCCAASCDLVQAVGLRPASRRRRAAAGASGR